MLDVAYRLGRTFAVPVRAEFTCPDSHTIVMTITDGEGTGSVVETHATPLTAPGVHPARTVMTEAVVATSDRFGFRVARGLAPLVRIGMRASATQLWADDLVYAARLYELRRADRRAGRRGCRGAPAAARRRSRDPIGTDHTPCPRMPQPVEQPVGRHEAGRRGALHQRHRQVAPHRVAGEHEPRVRRADAGARPPGLQPDERRSRARRATRRARRRAPAVSG